MNYVASERPDRGSGTHPGLSPRVKRQGREADYSPPFSAEVKNCGVVPSLPPKVFKAYCLINLAQGRYLLTFDENQSLTKTSYSWESNSHAIRGTPVTPDINPRGCDERAV
jgi:hypothetical protein